MNPTATPTEPSTPSSVWNTLLPHTGQKWKRNRAPWSPARTNSVAMPTTS